MRRFVSVIVAVIMMISTFATLAEAAVANWLSPQPGQMVTGKNVEVAVGYNTQSDIKVTKLELWVDGKFSSRKLLIDPNSRGVCSFTWDATQALRGSHDLVVKIYAGDQLITSISSTGTVGTSIGGGIGDSRPPTVTFANIKAGEVLKGKTNIKLKASDDSKETPIVSLLVDDSLKLLKNTPPYTYDLDTTTYTDGDHQLKSYAYDNAGNKSDPAVIKVAFKNGMQKPTVAALTVDHNPKPAISEDEMVKGLPSVTSQVALSAKDDSAARAVEPSTKIKAPAPATPVADAKVKASEPSVIVSTPKVVGEPKSSDATMVAMAPKVTVPSESSNSQNAELAAAMPSEVVDEPVSSEPANVTASASVALPKQSSSRIAVAPGKPGVPMDVPVEKIESAKQKNVQMAMLPKADNNNMRTSVIPPLPPKKTKAKIEKTTVSASGKVRARDLFEKLGGVMFWDPATHSAIAYVNDMKIEMEIGSNIAKINGVEMQLAAAPSLVNGRTVIDAKVYHQARAFAKTHGLSLSAKAE